MCLSTRTSLLPYLTGLACSFVGTKAPLFLAHVLAPGLTSLTLLLANMGSTTNYESIARSLRLEPQLRSLYITGLLDFNSLTYSIVSALGESLGMLLSLESFWIESWCLFYPEIWDALAGLPALRSISGLETIMFPHPSQPTDRGIRFDDGKFSSLEWVTLEGPHETLSSLFESTVSSKVNKTRITVLDACREVEAKHLLQSLAQYKNLAILDCAFHLDSFVLTPAFFADIASLGSLTTLRIRSERSIALTDDELGAFAAAMPQLEKLHLSIDPLNWEEPPVATFRAISEIARACPRLQSLGLFINTDPPFIPSIVDGEPIFEKIENLNFGLSSVVDPLRTVTFLAHACGPCPIEIQSGLSEQPKRHTIPEGLLVRALIVEDQWNKVAKGLEDFQATTRPLQQKIHSL